VRVVTQETVHVYLHEGP